MPIGFELSFVAILEIVRTSLIDPRASGLSSVAGSWKEHGRGRISSKYAITFVISGGNISEIGCVRRSGLLVPLHVRVG